MSRFAGMIVLAGLTATAGAIAPASALPLGPLNPLHAFEALQPLEPDTTLFWLASDEEDRAVERDLEPDEVPMTKSGGEMVPIPRRAEPSGSDVEDEEVKHDLETGG